MIPTSSPRASFLRDELLISQAVQSVLNNGRYIFGPETEKLERDFGEFMDGVAVAAVGSGTDGLVLALKAFGLNGHHEVIVPAMAPVAVCAAVLQAGCIPVIVDVVPETLTLNPVATQEAMNSNTRAIILIHLYGIPVATTPFVTPGITLIEDCSHAHGASYQPTKVGLGGDVGVFSCYPTKNLGALGNAGLVISNLPTVIAKIKRLRNYGDRYAPAGINSCTSEIQAAVLRIKLSALPVDNKRRRKIAALYDEHLPSQLGKLVYNRHSVYHQYVRLVKDDLSQDAFKAQMAQKGIEIGFHYRDLAHHRHWPMVVYDTPVADNAAKRVVSFPMYPELIDDQVMQVCKAVQEVLS